MRFCNLSDPLQANSNELLRLIILDFPKLLLQKENVKKMMGNILAVRQMSFRRTLETYIALDKHDMIGTHFVICDVSDIYNPKFLSGIRLTYMSRCQQYGLNLPLDENIQYASLPTQNFYRKFKNGKKEIAECNGWFVDPDFSYAKSKLDLAQMLFFALTTYLLRQNISGFIGAPNERYKASRWVELVGDFEKGHLFNHPAVNDPHQLTLLEEFRTEWLIESFDKFGSLLYSRYESAPEAVGLRSLGEVEKEIREKAKILKAS